MKKILSFALAVFFIQQLSAQSTLNSKPDSVYLLSYATTKNRGHNGLHYAWSHDGKSWNNVSNEFSFLRSDYGTWGAQKRMLSPFVIFGNDGKWHAIWSLNENESRFAHAESDDLISWRRQSYPDISEGNFLDPLISFDSNSSQYSIVFKSDNKFKKLTTSDFKTYSQEVAVNESDFTNTRKNFEIEGEQVSGIVHRVSWWTLDKILNHAELKNYKNLLYSETMSQDAVRFADLKPVDVTVKAVPEDAYEISDMLIGIFYEDINYAADGGLYAELIQNRSFEYKPSDRNNHDQSWNHSHSWSLSDNSELSIETTSPIHPNNPTYAVLDLKNPGVALSNVGFAGIVIRQGEKYDFSIFTRQISGRINEVKVRLVDENGNILAENNLKKPSSKWSSQQAILTAKASSNNAKLQFIPTGHGKLAVDMISLFPQNTFKNRKNGLRPDLAQVLADLKPRFIRFPGGCVAHGDGIHNIYNWKNTVGPIETRKGQRNIWNYHQSGGLGYFEYFQFCEDVGAAPLPIVAAGVPCQNSADGGQNGGIPMCDMDDYVQDVLDLIDWANGDPKTSKWAKMRADAGHPKPFNLKYVGVGNEDLITDVFEERFKMIFDAVKEKYPEIVVIGTVGPFYEGTDYDEGWDLATRYEVPIVDEHYYVSPGWYIHNQDYYDKYDRNKSKVYLGEYASHMHGRPNNLETALTEALHLINIERNGDVVHMTSYAPLLAKEGFTQWNPDLIYFNNTEVKPTVGYEVQKLFGNNSGTQYIPAKVNVDNWRDDVKKRFAISIVKESNSGDLIVKMVNLLPETANVKLELPVLDNTKVTRTILTGKPADRKLSPATDEIILSKDSPIEVSAYSLTILRIGK
ncbi:MAG: alpha-L-arabinofuranosidase [Porphyromonadaceae bacterium]|jgi:alpha-L-arabinofuranosidase|nr:alpha-L-arabinofuranosidase [Porphyromonadaceae bacterium]